LEQQTQFEATQEFLCKILAHYLVFIASRLKLPISGSLAQHLLSAAHKKWHKEGFFSWQRRNTLPYGAQNTTVCNEPHSTSSVSIDCDDKSEDNSAFSVALLQEALDRLTYPPLTESLGSSADPRTTPTRLDDSGYRQTHDIDAPDMRPASFTNKQMTSTSLYTVRQPIFPVELI